MKNGHPNLEQLRNISNEYMEDIIGTLTVRRE